MQITWIDNEGAGVPETINVIDGTTVDQIITLKKGGNWADKFSVRVNGERAGGNTPLSDLDRVSVVPQKIAAAR